MPNINVAVIGHQAYSETLGKRGTSTDITFYNLKRDDDSVTFIEPTKYPERLSSLHCAVSISQMAILVVDSIDARFGEAVVMLDCAGISRGLIVLRNSIQLSEIAPFIRGTVVEEYALTEDAPPAIREALLAEARSAGAGQVVGEPHGSVAVDHSFNVKGVGTVALGTVIRGVVRKHDELNVLPGDKKAQIRSIQKHDDDAEAASSGDRVGLALKGIEVDDLERGTLLTTDPSAKSEISISGEVEIVKYWREPLREGMAVHIGHAAQAVPGRIAELGASSRGEKASVKISLDKKIAYLPGGRAILMYLAVAKLRIIGTMFLP